MVCSMGARIIRHYGEVGGNAAGILSSKSSGEIDSSSASYDARLAREVKKACRLL